MSLGVLLALVALVLAILSYFVTEFPLLVVAVVLLALGQLLGDRQLG